MKPDGVRAIGYAAGGIQCESGQDSPVLTRSQNIVRIVRQTRLETAFSTLCELRGLKVLLFPVIQTITTS